MKTQFTTRIENEILEATKEISNKERRSLNNTVEFLLAKGIEVYRREQGHIAVVEFQPKSDKQ